MIVVSDTSAVLALYRISALHLLPTLFKEVFIPPAVYSELNAATLSEAEKAELFSHRWLSVREPENKDLVQNLFYELDLGESEAIALALEIHADFLLVDEKSARQISKEKGLKVMGVLGILAEAKRVNLVSELRPLLDSLRMEGEFWISETLYNRILQSVNEL